MNKKTSCGFDQQRIRLETTLQNLIKGQYPQISIEKSGMCDLQRYPSKLRLIKEELDIHFLILCEIAFLASEIREKLKELNAFQA